MADRATAAIPADDPIRTYAILLSGAETAGRYCPIDMSVPSGHRSKGAPPPRHSFSQPLMCVASS